MIKTVSTPALLHLLDALHAKTVKHYTADYLAPATGGRDIIRAPRPAGACYWIAFRECGTLLQRAADGEWDAVQLEMRGAGLRAWGETMADPLFLHYLGRGKWQVTTDAAGAAACKQAHADARARAKRQREMDALLHARAAR